MSVTVALQTYYGIEAPRDTFWVRTNETVVCGRDLNHTLVDGAKFCPACGHETKTVFIEEPSKRFAEICKKSKVEPAKFFAVLCGDQEHGWEWEDDGKGGSGKSFRLFWFNVEAILESASLLKEDGHISALGFRLDDVSHSRWNRERPRVSAYSWQDMEIYDRAMREVAKIFAVKGEPKLYSQVYYG
jgi:hypothetical protein